MKTTLLKIGSYSATIDETTGGYLACGFVMSGVHGLDVEPKIFKTKRGAIGYANRALAKHANANQRRVSL